MATALPAQAIASAPGAAPAVATVTNPAKTDQLRVPWLGSIDLAAQSLAVTMGG